MGSFAATVTSCFLIIFGLAVPSLGVNYTVDWRKGVDLTTYTLGKEFHVGDVLNFKYAPYTGFVVQVNLAGFLTCDTSNGSQLGMDGNTFFTFKTTGDFYFISFTVDCAEGLKLKVHVS